MRHLNSTEIANTSGGFNIVAGLSPTLTLGNCPVDFALPIVGAIVGATVSHGFFQNARLMHATIGGAVAGLAIELGKNYFGGKTA